MLCFVVVMQSFIMNSHEVFIHIHQGCFAGTGAIVRLPQCQWSKPDGYGKTTTKHSKAKTVCIFLGIYCKSMLFFVSWALRKKLPWHFNQNTKIRMEEMHLKLKSSGKYRPFCIGLNVYTLCFWWRKFTQNKISLNPTYSINTIEEE